MQLSIVVPVRNEAENILPLLAEIHATLEGPASFEVVYVDDGSTDATPQRLADALARYPRLRVFVHRERYGQSAALVTGFRAARGEWVATLDGDGQNDPADIPKLLAVRDGAARGAACAELQLICGFRTKRRDSRVKRIASRVAYGVRSSLLGDATPDTGCGLKLIARAACLELPVFDHMHRFLPALVQRNGGGTVSVEVKHRRRASGVSNYGVMDRLWIGIVDVCGLLWLQRRALRPEARELPRP